MQPPTASHRRGGRLVYTAQLRRLQSALDLAYALACLLLAGLSAFRGGAACLPAVLFTGGAALWGALLVRRAGRPPVAPALWWVVGRALALGGLLAIGAFVLATGPDHALQRAWLAAALGGAVLALELALAARCGWEGCAAARRLLIVGRAGRAAQFIRHLAAARLPVEVRGIVGCGRGRGSQPPPGKSVMGVPVVGLLGDLQAILKRLPVDAVVFLVSRRWLALAEQPMLACEAAGVRVLLSTDLYPFRLSQPRLEELGGLSLLAFEPVDHPELARTLKALLMDFGLAGALLVACAPLLAAIACAVKLTSRGPVFFKQTRCGLHGREFLMWKFRTMVPEAESMRRDLAGRNEMSGPVFKIREDPRVTPLGRFLRRTSLDELPQLLNVLAGDMSLVGPRPPLPEEVEHYAPWQRRRLSVKPGLTCIWQTSGRNDVGFEEWMRMDLDYIDNWSLTLDLKLLARTLPAILRRTGA